MSQHPLKAIADELKKHGRYGDSELIHINKAELEGIAALAPGGKLTTNPVTGQPEAFLPFLAPLVGGMLGSSFLTGAGAGVLGAAGLSSAAAGAIGSGLATALTTGDLRQGLVSGLTGWGIGSAMGGAADALGKTAGAAKGAQAGQHALATAQQAAAAAGPIAGPIRDAAQYGQQLTAAQGVKNAAESAARSQQALQAARQTLTPMERLGAPFQQPGAFMNAAMQPGAMLPFAYGMGEQATLQQMEQMNRNNSRAAAEDEATARRFRANFDNAHAMARRDFGPRRYAEGGITEIAAAQQPMNAAGKEQLIDLTAAALTGQISPPDADAIIQQFLETFGEEAFLQLRESVLQSRAPGAQTQGMVEGPGGPKDDLVPMTIGGAEHAAVSPGEYIVPADVVNKMGNGSSQQGAQVLDQMLASVRGKA